jgi:hypothetical protein
MISMPSEPAPRLQIAFLTGQSEPRSCALSPQQIAFGQALLAPGRLLQMQNFPYRQDSPAHAPVPLWRASWNNSRQHLASRGPGFARSHRAAVVQMLQAAPHTLLLAGSCGSELLANLALPPEALQRISLLAYGPVARRMPACARLLTVRGQQDWISRWGFGAAMQSIACGHMDYLAQPAFLTLASHFVAEVEACLPCGLN